MDSGEVLIRHGEVVYTDDYADGLRIKVRIGSDGQESIDNIPYAFPLLPKTFQSVPKVGEGAFVLLTMAENKESQRYYLGPIISQPQFHEECDYNNGRGNATSLLINGFLEPLEKISNDEKTWGSFPNVKDIAIVGRGSQDIILKKNDDKRSNEIDIRCGIRKNYEDSIKKRVGNIIFNSTDPAYIQLKYKKNLTNQNLQEANSMINLVADKINIISNNDENKFKLTDINELIKEDELDSVMSKLHRVPHGDTLIEALEIIIKAITTHVHPSNGATPTISNYTENATDWLGKLETILSQHVRIS